MHFDVYKVYTPTNSLFIKLDKVLKFTLKITSTCSHMFRSLRMAIIRKPSSEPSQSYARLKLGKKPHCFMLCGGVVVLSVTLNTASNTHTIN